ncbi:MAG: Tab2/Atab2 family RNA-binding protein [Geitlerinemataceae cyanobacterium]
MTNYPLTMQIWQVDFYRRPLQDESSQPLWELVICDNSIDWTYIAFCPQSEANSDWLAQQLQQANTKLPELLQLFRPECQSLLEAAGKQLGIPVEATRRTIDLKRLLQKRAAEYPKMSQYTGEDYQPISVYRPAPIPIPEEIWGDGWRFATLTARDLDAFIEKPIPVRSIPDILLPFNLGLASTQPIPGIVIDGGRQSKQLARWLQSVNPVAIDSISGDPDGIILESGLVDRWVLATFVDGDVAAAARTYQQRRSASKGLHFLLVQPDDSGMTYSGFWLLQPA